MRLRDKCWALGRNSGVVETTFDKVLRSDGSTEEFFATEAEAWTAEAARARREAESEETRASVLRSREHEATKKATALRSQSETSHAG